MAEEEENPISINSFYSSSSTARREGLAPRIDVFVKVSRCFAYGVSDQKLRRCASLCGSRLRMHVFLVIPSLKGKFQEFGSPVMHHVVPL
jgi:hypothetical protein